jgi:hypothetical protein
LLAESALRRDRVEAITNSMMHQIFTAELDWIGSMCMGNTCGSTQTKEFTMDDDATNPALPDHLQEVFDDVAEDLEEDALSARVCAAQRLIYAGIKLLREVADETDDGNAKIYIIDHLTILAGDHDFLTRDDNLDRWQRRLRREEDGDDEDDG